MRKPAIALGLLAILTAGCGPRDDKPEAAASPAQEAYSRWWRAAEQPTGAAATTQLTGTPLPGWQALPPLDPAQAKLGAALFNAKGCISCHSIGKGSIVGPDLQGVTHRVEPDWMRRFISNPEAMLATDPYAKQLLAKYLVKMPVLQLTPEEISALMAHLRQQDLQAASKKEAH